MSPGASTLWAELAVPAPRAPALAHGASARELELPDTALQNLISSPCN